LQATINNPGLNVDMFPSSGITYEMLGTSFIATAVTDSDQLLSISPNPARYGVSVTYQQYTPGIVRISIFNTLGERVMMFDSDARTPGEHTFPLPVEPLPPGSYSIVVSEDGTQSTGRLNIVR
jgi:hypothetical protein